MNIRSKNTKCFSIVALFTKLTLSSVITAALIGCASGNKFTPKIGDVIAEQTGQDGRACVRVNNIRGYGVNDDVINISAGRKYFVATTLYHCHNLELSSHALFDSRFTEACGGSAYIVTRNERCPIQHIFEFENRKEAHAAVKVAEEKLDAIVEEMKADKE